MRTTVVAHSGRSERVWGVSRRDEESLSWSCSYFGVVRRSASATAEDAGVEAGRTCHWGAGQVRGCAGQAGAVGWEKGLEAELTNWRVKPSQGEKQMEAVRTMARARSRRGAGRGGGGCSLLRPETGSPARTGWGWGGCGILKFDLRQVRHVPETPEQRRQGRDRSTDTDSGATRTQMPFKGTVPSQTQDTPASRPSGITQTNPLILQMRKPRPRGCGRLP